MRLSERYIEWVKQYAFKTCPPGCMPTPGQEREITLFAEVTCVLLEREEHEEQDN